MEFAGAVMPADEQRVNALALLARTLASVGAGEQVAGVGRLGWVWRGGGEKCVTP